jgi:hypothetical protein
VTPAGVVTTFAGRGTPGFADGAAAQALFQSPQSVAVDGNALYVADTLNHRIRRIANGSVTTVAGTGQGYLVTPSGRMRAYYPVSNIYAQGPVKDMGTCGCR